MTDEALRSTSLRRFGAAVLSFFAPGAGHVLMGRWDWGIAAFTAALVVRLAIPLSAFVGPAPFLVVAALSFLLSLGIVIHAAAVRPGTHPGAASVAGAAVGFFVLLVAAGVVTRSLLLEAYRIPSVSMLPTMHAGDHVFFDRISTAPPRRGEVILYVDSQDVSRVKRVVGLPGDVVEMRAGALHVNGVPAQSGEHAPDGVQTPGCERALAHRFGEALDGRRWEIYRTSGPAAPQDGRWTVPPDEVFVLGDNRDNSADSRIGGTVPVANVRGRPLFVWLSIDPCDAKIRTDRIGAEIP